MKIKVINYVSKRMEQILKWTSKGQIWIKIGQGDQTGKKFLEITFAEHM